MITERVDLVVELSDHAWARLDVLADRFDDSNRGSTEAVAETILDFALFAIEDSPYGRKVTEPSEAIEVLCIALCPEQKVVREAKKIHRKIESLICEIAAARTWLEESLEIEPNPHRDDESEGLGEWRKPIEHIRETCDWFSQSGSEFITSFYRASGGYFGRSCSRRLVSVSGSVASRFGRLCNTNIGDEARKGVAAVFIDLVLQFIRSSGSMEEEESESLREALLWRYLLLRTRDQELREVIDSIAKRIELMEVEFSRKSVFIDPVKFGVFASPRDSAMRSESPPQPSGDWEDLIV